MLYAMEIDPAQAKAEFSQFAQDNDVSKGARDLMGSVGLGGLADQLGDLKLVRPRPRRDNCACVVTCVDPRTSSGVPFTTL